MKQFFNFRILFSFFSIHEKLGFKRMILFSVFILPSILVYAQQSVTIHGQVRDENRNPLVGVTVKTKNNATGTVTNMEGNYSLVVADTAILIVSYVGYQTREIPVNGKNKIDIILKQGVSSLDQVVVVGYGTQQQKDLTSAITTISSNDLEDLGSNVRIDNALKGKAPGVRIQQVSGQPGSAPYIRIRGVSTFTAGNNPLWVIDGVPTTDPNILRNLDLSNVESINILKGAAAAAIYGSQGSNGVIIVKRKKGQSGKFKFEVDVDRGWSKSAKRIDVLNGPEEARFIKTARDNAWVDAGGSLDDPISSRPYTMQYPIEWNDPNYKVPSYDYQDFLFRTGLLTNLAISASGGSDKATFYVNGGYSDEDGTVRRTNFKKYSLSTNIDIDITDYMSLAVSLNPSRSINNMPGAAGKGSIIHRTVLSTPYAFSPLAGVPGSGVPAITQGYFATPTFGLAVPSLLWKKDKQEENQIVGSANLSINILPELEYKLMGGYIFSERTSKAFYPLKITQINNELPNGSLGEAKSKNYVINQTLTYDKIFNDIHKFSLMLGYSSELHQNFNSTLSGINFPNDLVETLNAAKDISGSSNRSEWSLISYLARINYSFKDRYLINVNLRRDGSSRFGKKNRWGYFPSLSVGWVISNESFFKSDVFNFVKLRSGYGITGNNQIGDYTHIAKMGIMYAAFGDDEALNSGYYPTNPGNEELGWERLKSLDIGVDIHLLENRISFTMDAYRNMNTSLLMNVRLPAHTGFNSQVMNIGKVLNRGYEFQVTSHNLSHGRLDWITNLSLSFNKNKVKALGLDNAPILSGPSWAPVSYTAVGHPIGAYYMLEQIGVWNTQEEIDHNPHWEGARPGDPRLKDWNKDGMIDNDDRHFMGVPNPKYIYGMRNNFKYSNFSLSFFINGAGGNKILNVPEIRSSAGESHTEHSGFWRNFWKGPDNPGDPMVPEPNDNLTGAKGKVTNARGLLDASYIQLSNVTLGYTFPEKFSNMVHLKDVKIYLKGNNLWLHDNAPTIYNVEGQTYDTGSPLTGGGYGYVSYPLSKQFIVSLNVTF